MVPLSHPCPQRYPWPHGSSSIAVPHRAGLRTGAAAAARRRRGAVPHAPPLPAVVAVLPSCRETLIEHGPGGELVGVDYNGNKYFEKKDAQWGELWEASP